MIRILVSLFILVVTGVIPASGQIFGTGVSPVIEVGPTAQNATITAFQSTISAVQNVIQSGYQLLDITPFDDLALAAEWAEEMALLGALLHEGQGLMGDVTHAHTQIVQLFSLDATPRTPSELSQRIHDIQAVIFEARLYAVRVQTLVSSITSAVQHVGRITQLLGILKGNLQGSQAQIQLLAVANATLATQTAQAAATQRVTVLEQFTMTYVLESYNRIQADRWSDWPALLGGEGQ